MKVSPASGMVGKKFRVKNIFAYLVESSLFNNSLKEEFLTATATTAKKGRRIFTTTEDTELLISYSASATTAVLH
jgi:hypothetical protein